MNTKLNLQERLTKWWLKSNGRKFIETKQFNLPGNKTVKAYLFEKLNDDTLGQLTPFGTIILNKKTTEFQTNALNYVLLHELGHKKLNILISIPMIIGVLSTLFTLVITISGLIAFSIGFIITRNRALPLMITSTIISVPIIAGAYIVLQYTLEGYADYQAIKAMKPKKFLKARAQIKERNKNNKYPKWYIYLMKATYPNAKWTIKIYEHFNKKTINSTTNK